MEAELTEAITNIVLNALADVHTALPAKVVSYDHTKRKANCKPLIKKAYRDGTQLSLPIINNVPVVWLGTKKGMVHFPLEKDDGVLLIFSERPLDTWLTTDIEDVPKDGRKFDLTDAIAIPGLFSFKGDSLADNNDDAIVKYLDSEVRLKGDGDIVINCPDTKNINLGNSSLKTLVNEEMQALYNNHRHNYINTDAGVPVIGNTSTPVSFTGLVAPPPTGILPSVPPAGLLGDEVTAAHLTSKTKAQ